METTSSKVLVSIIVVILVGAVAGVGGYSYGRQADDTTSTPTSTSTETVTSTPTTTTTSVPTKEVSVLSGTGDVVLNFDIPVSWSSVMFPENIGDTSFPTSLSTASVAADSVTFGDVAPQVDIYFSSAKLSTAREASSGSTVSQIVIDGVDVTKVEYSSDPDEGGRGGTEYVFNLNTSGIKTVKILKQIEGDAEFEAGVTALIESLEIN